MRLIQLFVPAFITLDHKKTPASAKNRAESSLCIGTISRLIRFLPTTSSSNSEALKNVFDDNYVV